MNKYIFHNLISFQTLDITGIFHLFCLRPSSELLTSLKFSKIGFQLHLICHLLLEWCPAKHLTNFCISISLQSHSIRWLHHQCVVQAKKKDLDSIFLSPLVPAFHLLALPLMHSILFMSSDKTMAQNIAIFCLDY